MADNNIFKAIKRRESENEAIKSSLKEELEKENSAFPFIVDNGREYINLRRSTLVVATGAVLVLAFMVVGLFAQKSPVQNVSGTVYSKVEAFMYEVESQGFFNKVAEMMSRIFIDNGDVDNYDALKEFLEPYIQKCDRLITESSSEEDKLLIENVKAIYKQSAVIRMMENSINWSGKMLPDLTKDEQYIAFKEQVANWRYDLSLNISVMKSMEMDKIKEITPVFDIDTVETLLSY
ncbi:MAG: hypothetical protein ACOYJD_08015 [Christensenellales bacterium]|jgi:hypothetical protein